MAEYGLGNFVYELTVSDGAAHFKFRDPEDASNTAEVSVAQKDFPEGIVAADSRQVADIELAQCSKVLNDKRDARIKQEQAAALKAQQEADAAAREAAADFHNSSNELANTTPTGTPSEKIEQPEDTLAPPHKNAVLDTVPESEVAKPAAPAPVEPVAPAPSGGKKGK